MMACTQYTLMERSCLNVRKKLTILSTHPVQYHAHWFRNLAARPEIDLSVYYCYHAAPTQQARAGFGVEFDWDVPLLEGYRYTFLNAPRHQARKSIFEAAGFRSTLARENPDAVLVNGWHYSAAWKTIVACWRAGIPVMVRGDSQLASPRGWLKRLLKYPVYRSFIPRFDACLAVGSRSRNYYLHYGARPGRLFVVPHAVQEQLFSRAAENDQIRRILRRHYGFSDQQRVFAFVGKFIEKKRPMDFLRALDAAVKEQPTATGLMVGDGPLRGVCEQFVASRRLPVHFTGFLNQSQIGDAYGASDCLVLPSDGWETWGLVVNEAMSCGRPAVVSDAVGCGPDLVREGSTGAVFPFGNVEALSRILVDLAGDPSRLQAMGERARARLRSYSLEAAVQGVIDALEAVTVGRASQ